MTSEPVSTGTSEVCDFIPNEVMRGKSLVMFDLDGTLIEGHVRRRDGDKGPFEQVLPFGKVIPLPKTIARLQYLRDEGLGIAVCTNKAGVAYGHITEDDCLEKALTFFRTFNLPNRVLYLQAFGHPEAPIEKYRGDDPWRKPNPGMLVRALERFKADPEDAFFVGDMEADRLAAKHAGVEFHWAEDYFGW